MPKEEKQEDKKKRFLVVEKLPTQEANKLIDNEGNEIDLLTRDEAFTEMLDILRKLNKNIG